MRWWEWHFLLPKDLHKLAMQDPSHQNTTVHRTETIHECRVSHHSSKCIHKTYPVLWRITWETSHCHKFGIWMDQKLNGICVLKEKEVYSNISKKKKKNLRQNINKKLCTRHDFHRSSNIPLLLLQNSWAPLCGKLWSCLSCSKDEQLLHRCITWGESELISQIAW